MVEPVMNLIYYPEEWINASSVFELNLAVKPAISLIAGSVNKGVRLQNKISTQKEETPDKEVSSWMEWKLMEWTI
mgnify:FL=1|jgi:hypothetical protein